MTDSTRKTSLPLKQKIVFFVITGCVMFCIGLMLNLAFGPLVDRYNASLPAVAEAPESNDTPHKSAFTSRPEYTYHYTIKKGDNFSTLLSKSGVSAQEILLAGRTIRSLFNPHQLQIGQDITVVLRERSMQRPPNYHKHQDLPGLGGDTDLEFALLQVHLPDRTVEVEKDLEGQFSAWEKERELIVKPFYAEGVIESSLSKLADQLNIPPNILVEAIRYYSFDVDFQRDIHKGARFKIFYEGHYDNKGRKIRDGNLLYALLTINDKDLEIYRFKPPNDAAADYYTSEGRAIRRSLMKTPINGAVVSSHFGKRKHPISGYTRLHKGIDFAAPRGTPIFAAGDGKIDFLGKNGGYGNYVRIRHNSEYSTAYAHIHRFAKGMTKGKRVKQGQIIAYVGSTGASTGPHLHYEIIRNGTHVNPARVTVAPGKQLDTQALARFRKRKEAMMADLSEISRASSNVAQIQ